MLLLHPHNCRQHFHATFHSDPCQCLLPCRSTLWYPTLLHSTPIQSSSPASPRARQPRTHAMSNMHSHPCIHILVEPSQACVFNITTCVFNISTSTYSHVPPAPPCRP